MTDTKPTPGPYKRDGQTVYALQPSGGGWVAHVQEIPFGAPEAEAEAEAVAQLFEAAPDMAAALRSLVIAYVGMLENARDRIIALGGQCDSVRKMEDGDPALRAARDALAKAGVR